MVQPVKHVRNGIPDSPPAGGGNVAQPEPAANTSAIMHAAENYGNSQQESGHGVWVSGVPRGINVPDWDAGAAITEQVGEH